MPDIFQYFDYDDRARPVFRFGKHKGELAEDHRDYLEWMAEQDFPKDTMGIVEEVLGKD